MKMKKVLAAVSAAAMCASVVSTFATSASALAQGNAIDFEDGDSSFVYLNIYDGGTDATVSVADFNGSKQLKIDPVDYTKSPKVWFDLDKIMERATATEIYTIEMDITFAPVDPAGQLGWIGGGLGAAGGFDKDNIQASQAKPNWSSDSWELTDGNNYVDGGISTVHATKKFLLPSSKYSVDGTNPFFCIMAWEGITADYDMYVDNIVFKNKAGDTLSVGVAAAPETEAPAADETAAAPAETEAAATEAAPAETEAAATEAAPAETEAAATEAAPAETTAAATTAAPDAAATTPVKTGNVPAAAMAVVMVASAAAAVIAKRK